MKNFGNGLFLMAALFLGLSAGQSRADDQKELLPLVDHVVYFAPDLAKTIADLKVLFGVEATPGGQHLGQGTRNYLIAIGPRRYLEILGPDPSQGIALPDFLAKLKSPKVIGWAMGVNNIEEYIKEASDKGVKLHDVYIAKRKKADGTIVIWKLSAFLNDKTSGVAPFFIDWGTTEHPSAEAVKGPRLVGLIGQHPNLAEVQNTLDSLKIPLPVSESKEAELVATFQTDKGKVELR